MHALNEFVRWWVSYVHVDKSETLPEELRLSYHARSDIHSVKLTELVLDDLLENCGPMREQAARGEIAYGINYTFTWPNGKRKTLDLAIGIPSIRQDPPSGSRMRRVAYRAGRGAPPPPSERRIDRLLVACEAKSVMTEHGKSQPRIFDELNGSHAIVHAGSRDTIAAGITVVNLASSFVSALRQKRGLPVEISLHNQPEVTKNMVNHLRQLPLRTETDAVGFEAYCSFVVDVDNQGIVRLHTDSPAPQQGDPDHYETFLHRISEIYVERFGDLTRLPDTAGLSVEEALRALAMQYPGLLNAAGELVVERGFPGAPELRAILRAIESQASIDPPS